MDKVSIVYFAFVMAFALVTTVLIGGLGLIVIIFGGGDTFWKALGGRDFNASSAVDGYTEKDAIITMIANVVYFLIVVWAWKRYKKKETV